MIYKTNWYEIPKVVSPALLMSCSSDPTTNSQASSNFLTNESKSENSGFVVPELVAGSDENDKKQLNGTAH